MPKSARLLTGAFNPQIEEAVEKHLGRPWKIEEIAENKAKAMHSAAVFKGNGYSVFVKEGENPFSSDQFTQEAWGLRHIRENSSAATPEVIDVLQIGGFTLLVMEAVAVKPVREKREWETLGRGLAALHRTQRKLCGLETHSYLGIFKQVNTQTDSWIDFFAERRLRDSFALAAEAGKLNTEELLLVERSLDRLIARLPDICGPVQPFSLLHGDPWLANLLYDGQRLVMVDCSVYYGNREIDLSTVALFCPVSDYFFGAYHECYPIDPGYPDRVSLWRVNQWLGHVTLGAKHLPKLMNAISRYL